MTRVFLSFFLVLALTLPVVRSAGLDTWRGLVRDMAFHHSPQKGGGHLPVNSLFNGLQVYWSLDETSGNRAAAFQAASLTLTDNNTVGNAAGKIGNAASFTAASDETLSVSDNAAVSIGDIDWTITFWFFLSGLPAGDWALVSKWDASGSPNSEYLISREPSSTNIFFAVTSDGDAFSTYKDVQSSATTTTSTWYFVVCQHDAAADQISVSVNNGTFATGTHVGGIYDGAHSFELAGIDSTINNLNGRLDMVGIWKRKLTAAEITYLYNSGNGRSPIP